MLAKAYFCLLFPNPVNKKGALEYIFFQPPLPEKHIPNTPSSSKQSNPKKLTHFFKISGNGVNF